MTLKEEFNYSYAIMIYEDKFIDILLNLDENNNTTLRKAILSNELNPSIIANLSSSEINPLLFSDILIRKQLQDETLNYRETTDMYQCKKCKERKFTIETRQTRCADEGETLIFTCTVCGFVFTK